MNALKSSDASEPPRPGGNVDADRIRRARSIFEEVAGQVPEEWLAAVRRRCGSDYELLRLRPGGGRRDSRLTLERPHDLHRVGRPVPYVVPHAVSEPLGGPGVVEGTVHARRFASRGRRVQHGLADALPREHVRMYNEFAPCNRIPAGFNPVEPICWGSM